MVNYCVAYGCKNKAKKDSSFSFHIFPHSNSELLAKWIQAIRRKDWQPTKNSFLCSKPSCFVNRPGKIGHRLNPGAIPSLFPAFPEYLQKSATKRKSPTKRKQLAAGLQAQASPSIILKRIETYHTHTAEFKVEVIWEKIHRNVIHGNVPSVRHTLTKAIIFKNQ